MPYIYVICINACLYLETVLKREDIGFLWDKELEDIWIFSLLSFYLANLFLQWTNYFYNF